MKETGILMTPENAQKCHVGTKTMTRRLNGLERANDTPDEVAGIVHGHRETWLAYGPHEKHGQLFEIRCPYGEVGDRLWIRESIYIDHFDYAKGPLPKEKPDLDDGMLIYRGEGTCCQQFGECDCGGDGAPWRPSIHMPRWACRTVGEITEIRAERLQEISETDAKAEGCKSADLATGRECFLDPSFGSYRLTFRSLWESINGPGSWDANHWVWVIGFRKVTT